MVIRRTGDTYNYEGVAYTIGGRVYANGQSDWEGLFGSITEIRTGTDKETENETPDIYCSFDAPVLQPDVKELEEHFSSLYQEPKKLEDICLDEVIMAPEMIEPLQSWADREKKEVWAVAVDWSCHGEQGHMEEICAEYLDAKRKLTEHLSEEFENSELLRWQEDERYAVISEKDSYECYEKDNYQNNHYHICIERKDLVLSPAFIRETADMYQKQSRREDVLSHIVQNDACGRLTDDQYGHICQDTDMPDLLERKLGRNELYWEAYWDSVDQVVAELVKKHTGGRNTGGGAE